MRAPRPVPNALRTGAFARAVAIPLVSDGALRGPSYDRLGHGVYRSTAAPRTHVDVIGAARSRLGDHPVLLGPSAAWALGTRLAPEHWPAHIAVEYEVAASPIRVPRRCTIEDTDVVETRLGRTTSPVRTCIDLARGIGIGHLDIVWRVAWVDAVLHVSGVPVALVRDRAAQLPRLRGMRAAAGVLAQARNGAESVRETLLRVLVVADGFPEPELQFVIHGRNGIAVARLDMAWPAHKAGAEYDGAHHRERDRHSRDLWRHNDLRSSGWRVLQVDSANLRQPAAFLEHLEDIVPRAQPSMSTLPDLWRPGNGHLWRW